MLIQIDQCSSTQSLIKNLEFFDKEIIGVFTLHQTQGVGQSGTRWISKPIANVAISFRFRECKFPSSQYFNFWFTTQVFDFIRKRVSEIVSIKWPNDIIIKHKKVAGLLIEKSVDFYYAGVGINVFEKNFNTAGYIAEFAHDLRKMQTAIDRVQYLIDMHQTIYQELVKSYQLIDSNAFQELKNNFEKHLYRKDRVSVFQTTENQCFNGIIRGVTDGGELLIETEFGVKKFVNKEIQLLN